MLIEGFTAAGVDRTQVLPTLEPHYRCPFSPVGGAEGDLQVPGASFLARTHQIAGACRKEKESEGGEPAQADWSLTCPL